MDRSSEQELLASDAKLSILAKHIVDGIMIGVHRGTRRGIGSEFSQYRSYQPGDDIRRIDWNMFARSDRYYIKESETETSVTIRFFLDASASMLYHEQGVTRFKYASALVAAMATLGYQQGDAMALHIVNHQKRTDAEENRGKSHLNRVITILEDAECAGNWPESADWLPDILTSHRRELWIVCSDFLDGTGAWKSIARLSETFSHEVRFIQVLGEKELNFSFDGVMTLKDPESNRERSIRAGSVRDQYLRNLHAYQKELKHVLAGRKNSHHLISMDQPLADALRSVLMQPGVVR